MKVFRVKGTEIRRYKDDNGELLGLAGTVAELESKGILSHSGTGAVAPPDMWCRIDKDANILDFVQSKEAAKLVFMEF